MRFWKALYCFSPISKLPISREYCLCLSKETAFCFALICLFVCLFNKKKLSAPYGCPRWVLPPPASFEKNIKKMKMKRPHNKTLLAFWLKTLATGARKRKQKQISRDTALWEHGYIYISFARYNRSIIKSSVRILKTKRVSVSREEWIWSLQVKMCTTLTISNRQTKPKRKENFFFNIKEVRQP